MFYNSAGHHSSARIEYTMFISILLILIQRFYESEYNGNKIIFKILDTVNKGALKCSHQFLGPHRINL